VADAHPWHTSVQIPQDSRRPRQFGTSSDQRARLTPILLVHKVDAKEAAELAAGSTCTVLGASSRQHTRPGLAEAAAVLAVRRPTPSSALVLAGTRSPMPVPPVREAGAEEAAVLAAGAHVPSRHMSRLRTRLARRRRRCWRAAPASEDRSVQGPVDGRSLVMSD
jgi:hypothetical protein